MTWRTKLSASLGVLICMAAAPSLTEPSPKRPRIEGIYRVTILSTDVPQAQKLYMKLLGINQEACNWCETATFGPLFVNLSQTIRLQQNPAALRDNLILSIVFKTNDARELRRYLKAQKIQINKEDSAATGIVSLNDPEGHHIIFAENLLTVPIQIVGATAFSAPAGNLHLIHAGFIVHDRAATEHFYKDILGFRPYWHGGMKDDGKDDWVSLQVPDGTDWIEMMVNVSPDPDQRLRGIMNHIAIGVTDIHATEQRLKGAGVNLTEEPKIGRDGKWQLNAYDPDLTRIEFMEFTPVQKPCCSGFTAPHPHP